MGCAFCDSSFAWDVELVGNVTYYAPGELTELAGETIPFSIHTHDNIHIVITGGEPLLFQELIPALIVNLKRRGFRFVQVETNGTITPTREVMEAVDWWNCSPKLSNCGVPVKKRINRDALRFLSVSGRADFKFVVRDEKDVNEVSESYEGLVPIEKIWLMPEGSNRENQINRMSDIAEIAVKRGYRFSPRLHLLMWDNQRGR